MRILVNKKQCLLQRLGQFLLATVGLIPVLVGAVPGIEVVGAGPNFASAKYEEANIDMRIKVLGGFIKHQRTLEDGIEWKFNRAWSSLELQFAIGDDPQVDLPIAIERNGFSYEPVGGETSPTFVFDERRWISKTAGGWRWQDRSGDWIDYDPDGRILAYGDRNKATVSFTRDANGQIDTVKDHNDTVVLTFAYNPVTGFLETATDYTNRSVSYAYNVQGQLETVTDVRGETWTYDYTDYGTSGIQLLTSITDPETNVKTFSYIIQEGLTCTESTGGSWSYNESTGDWGLANAQCANSSSQPPSALLKSISDEEGIIAQYKFLYVEDGDNSRFTTAEVDGAGGLTTLTFNIDGEILEEQRNGRVVSRLEIEGRTRTWTDENGRTTVIQYDQWDNPIKETYADNSFVLREYDAVFTNITRYTDENGVVTKYDYDANGNLIRMTEALGLLEQRITEYAYDSFGNQTQIRSIADAVTAEAAVNITYDTYGNINSYTDAEGHVTEYLIYDVLGNALEMKDPRGNIWKYEFDAAGNLLSERTPLQIVTAYFYDKVGNLYKVTDAHTKDALIGYDARRRFISVTNPLLETSIISYNGRDQITSLIDPGGQEIAIGYDQDGRVTQVTDSGGNSATLSYEGGAGNSYNGVINSVEFPTFTEALEYDERYRVTKVRQSGSDVLGRNFSVIRDARGNIVESTRDETRVHQLSYDYLNRTISELDNTNNLTRVDYDNRNNITRVTNARSVPIREYQYDRNNRRVEELLPSGDTILEQRYDPNGNLILTTDAKGQIAKYDYDPDNRLLQVQYFNDLASSNNPINSQKTVLFGYDDLNRLVSYSDGTTSGIYDYDDAGRLTNNSVDYGGFTLSQSYTWYPSGQKKTYTGPDNITYAYTYDTGGRLQSVDIPGQGKYTVNQYRWDAPELVTLPGGGEISVAYDSYMRTQQIRGLDPADNTILDVLYGIDPLDNVVVRETLEARYEYSYDAADRLAEVESTSIETSDSVSASYNYDSVGNRDSDSRVTDEFGNLEIWDYDDADRLLQKGDVSYVYDANGSRTLLISSNPDENRSYHYDFENRLTEIRDQNNTTIASYRYDPFGRRISKTDDTNSTTYYLYGDDGLMAEADSAGNIIVTYGYQPNTPWGTDPMYIKQGNIYGFYITDHLGTPQRIVGASGNVLWSAVYDAFGEATLSVETMTNNLRLPGQYYDEESSLHYNFQRYYDPSIGRYVSSDPIGLIGGFNTYAYAASSPLVHIDPEGKLIPVAAIVVGALVRGFAGALYGSISGALCVALNDGSPADIAAGFGIGLVGGFVAGIFPPGSLAGVAAGTAAASAAAAKDANNRGNCPSRAAASTAGGGVVGDTVEKSLKKKGPVASRLGGAAAGCAVGTLISSL